MDEAVSIEEEIQKNSDKKTPQLGRYYYVQGSLNQQAGNTKATLECYKKS